MILYLLEKILFNHIISNCLFLSILNLFIGVVCLLEEAKYDLRAYQQRPLQGC
jgi:hypothetical protein